MFHPRDSVQCDSVMDVSIPPCFRAEGELGEMAAGRRRSECVCVCGCVCECVCVCVHECV